MNKCSKVLLVDSEKLVRTALASLINSIPGISVVAEASDYSQALDIAAAEESLDTLITEIALPGISGLELILELNAETST